MKLVVNGVEFGYDSTPTIRDVTFAVDEGDILTIMGPNGVGKTTLLKCLNRMLEPRGGSVLVEDEDIRTMKRREIARRVGFVSQRSEVSRMIVYDMILLGRIARIGWGAGEYDHEVTRSVIELLGLDALALRYADELSGGEFQLVQVARALAQEPRVMILDEPTSNLDISNQHRLMSMLHRVVQSGSIAAVMTIHDINLSIRYSNKFILMREGTVFAAGGREIVTRENIGAVYNIDVHIAEIDGVPFVVPR